LRSIVDEVASDPITTEAECLDEILEAFRDIADQNDIQHAVERLARVQEWIFREAEAVEIDPARPKPTPRLMRQG